MAKCVYKIFWQQFKSPFAMKVVWSRFIWNLVPEIFEVPAPVQSNMKEKRLFIFPIIRIFFENHVRENLQIFS